MPPKRGVLRSTSSGNNARLKALTSEDSAETDETEANKPRTANPESSFKPLTSRNVFGGKMIISKPEGIETFSENEDEDARAVIPRKKPTTKALQTKNYDKIPIPSERSTRATKRTGFTFEPISTSRGSMKSKSKTEKENEHTKVEYSTSTTISRTKRASDIRPTKRKSGSISGSEPEDVSSKSDHFEEDNTKEPDPMWVKNKPKRRVVYTRPSQKPVLNKTGKDFTERKADKKDSTNSSMVDFDQVKRSMVAFKEREAERIRHEAEEAQLEKERADEAIKQAAKAKLESRFKSDLTDLSRYQIPKRLLPEIATRFEKELKKSKKIHHSSQNDKDNINLASSDVEDESLSRVAIPKYSCPFCDCEISESLYQSYGAAALKDKRNREAIHKSHEKETAVARWTDLGLPNIDWDGLEERCKEHIPTLAGIISGNVVSHYRNKKLEQKKTRKTGAAKLHDEFGGGDWEEEQAGYYGPRGVTIMIAVIARSTKLKQLLLSQDLPIDLGQYTTAILLPELATRLIMDDMSLNLDAARRLMNKTNELGHALSEDVFDAHSSPMRESQRVDDDAEGLGFQSSQSTDLSAECLNYDPNFHSDDEGFPESQAS